MPVWGMGGKVAAGGFAVSDKWFRTKMGKTSVTFQSIPPEMF